MILKIRKKIEVCAKKVREFWNNDSGSIDDSVGKVVMIVLGVAVAGGLFAVAGTAVTAKAKHATKAVYDMKVTTPSSYNMSATPNANAWVTNATSETNTGIMGTVDMSK